MSGKQLLKSAWDSILDFFFPPICHSCAQPLTPSHSLLCAECLKEMPFSDAEECCRTCAAFTGKEECKRCLKDPPPFRHAVALFHENAHAIKLLSTLSGDAGGFLATSLASLMLLQMDKAKLPFPDFIIPSADVGSLKLAEALSKMTSIPHLNPLLASNWLHPHTRLKKRAAVKMEDAHLLLLSSGIKGVAILKEEGEVLLTAYPKSVNALLFQRPL